MKIIIQKEKVMKRGLSKFGVGCLVALCFSLTACKQGASKDVIKPPKMEEFLYDYYLAKSMVDELPYEDRYKQPLYLDYVYNKHHITKAQFDSSMVWYTRNTEELSKIYTNVGKRLKGDQGAINHLIALRDNKPKMSESGDTVNVWYDKKLHKLTPTVMSNKIAFTLTTDTNFKTHDELRWKIRYNFLKPKTDKRLIKAIMAMSFTFDNDSILAVSKKVDKSGWYTLSLKSDSAYKIKEVRGFVYLPGDSLQTSLLIDNISLTRFHRPKQDSINIAKGNALKSDSIKNDSIKKAKELADKKELAKKDSAKVKLEQRVRRNPHDMDRPRPRKSTNREVRR